jgi:hypothetical protein
MIRSKSFNSRVDLAVKLLQYTWDLKKWSDKMMIRWLATLTKLTIASTKCGKQ